MIWIDCNPAAGREMKDVHPLLVLSPSAFNQRTGYPGMCPTQPEGRSFKRCFATNKSGSCCCRQS
jgi:mRNA interferase MazF